MLFLDYQNLALVDQIFLLQFKKKIIFLNVNWNKIYPMYLLMSLLQSTIKGKEKQMFNNSVFKAPDSNWIQCLLNIVPEKLFRIFIL